MAMLLETVVRIDLEAYMATVKEEIRRMVESLPEDVTWEDLQYSIYVRERIERARREAADGKILDEGEVERRMKPWLTK
jgi:hypothetical protein